VRGLTLGVTEGERIGVVGRNGDGKSTLLALIAGTEEPDAGAVTRLGGLSVALIAQTDELDTGRTIREAVVGGRADHEWAADAGFRSVLDGLLGGLDAARFPAGLDTAIAGLSGGERRRIGLAKLLLDSPDLLLLDSPDLLLLDEPTNDLGSVTHLPGGIEQYLELRRAAAAAEPEPAAPRAAPARPAGVQRDARKEVARIERALAKLDDREVQLHEAMAEAATDHARLSALDADLRALALERETLEAAWMETSALLE
jgi:ABC-type glutathione transport system ATPase component